MPARELYANDLEETMAAYLSKFEPSANIMSGELCTKLFQGLIRSRKLYELNLQIK